jgi:hypothetical protein
MNCCALPRRLYLHTRPSSRLHDTPTTRTLKMSVCGKCVSSTRLLIAIALLIPPCDSYINYEISLDTQTHQLILFCGICILLFVLCYIFYPAYASLECNLGCVDVVLAGGVENYQGKIVS